MKKVYIGSDHGGFELKNKIIILLKNAYDIEDMGAYELDPSDDYPDFALKVARAVAKNRDSLGILICRSGNGVCIAANKVKGAYAALCFSPKHATKAREDDNANIVCLDADYGEDDEHFEIVDRFLKTQFAGMDTRHGRRFHKIVNYENIDN